MPAKRRVAFSTLARERKRRAGRYARHRDGRLRTETMRAFATIVNARRALALRYSWAACGGAPARRAAARARDGRRATRTLCARARRRLEFRSTSWAAPRASPPTRPRSWRCAFPDCRLPVRASGFFTGDGDSGGRARNRGERRASAFCRYGLAAPRVLARRKPRADGLRRWNRRRWLLRRDLGSRSTRAGARSDASASSGSIV